MEKAFNKSGSYFYNGIKTITVEHAFDSPSLGEGFLNKQVAGIDDILKASDIAIKLPESHDDVSLHIVLKNRYLEFEIRELGSSRPIQTSEVSFGSFHSSIMNELKYATHEDISSGRREHLHWNMANEFLQGMKGEGFTFQDENTAHNALQKLVAIWFEEEIISKPEHKQTYTIAPDLK